MALQLAFRNAYLNDAPYDRAIRWWTGSPYSHCELVIDGGMDAASACFSASAHDNIVRTKTIVLHAEKWVLVPAATIIDVAALQKSEDGKPYDYWGALTWHMPWQSVEFKKKWFCSELCAAALGLPRPWTFAPGDLYSRLAK